MQAWTVHEFGNYREQLVLEEHGRPEVTGSDALIKVKAIGINFFDLLTIAGKYQVKAPLPFVPGGEAAGEVVAVGDSCPLKVGEHVMTSNAGAFAEYMLAPQDATYWLPENMSYEDAAAFQLIYQTSYFALVHRAGLKKGEYLLVHGGGAAAWAPRPSRSARPSGPELSRLPGVPQSWKSVVNAVQNF